MPMHEKHMMPDSKMPMKDSDMQKMMHEKRKRS